MNDIFLKVDGITGESKDSSHQGWINAMAYTWGARHNSEASGSGKVNYHDLTAHCQVDKATATLLLYSSNGNKIRSVEIVACKAGGSQIEYYKITLENVIVSEVIFRDSGSSTEVSYSFQSDKVKFQYWEQEATGIKGAETRMGWDIKNSTSCF